MQESLIKNWGKTCLRCDLKNVTDFTTLSIYWIGIIHPTPPTEANPAIFMLQTDIHSVLWHLCLCTPVAPILGDER